MRAMETLTAEPTARPIDTATSVDACPVCSGRTSLWRWKQTVDRYRIERCRRCGYAFVNPRPPIAELMRYYADAPAGSKQSVTLAGILEDEHSFPNSTLDAQRMVSTIRSLQHPEVPRTFLDVGCGYGFYTHAALRRDYAVTAIELGSHERNLARSLTGIAPLDTSFEAFAGKPGSFGVVLMSQILEHAHDVNAWVAKAHGLLAPGGILAIALPNFASFTRRLLQEREPYITPPEHLNFFSSRSMSRLLREHGFDVISTQCISRVRPQAYERRLARPLASVVRASLPLALRAIDTLGMGIMLNAFARKRIGG
jgi:SAM-dependent methyltransferase